MMNCGLSRVPEYHVEIKQELAFIFLLTEIVFIYHPLLMALMLLIQRVHFIIATEQGGH